MRTQRHRLRAGDTPQGPPFFRWFRAQPLRRQLFLAILLLLVPVLAAAAWSGLVTFRERVAELGEQARVVARTTAAYVDSDIDGLDRTAVELSSHPAVRDLDAAGATQVLQQLLAQRSRIRDVVVVRPNGGIVARAELDDPLPFQWEQWTPKAAAATTRWVSPMQMVPGTGAFLGIGYPLRTANGPSRGVLWLFVSLTSLQQVFAELPLPPGSSVSINDADRRILVRSLEPEKYVGTVLAPDPGLGSTETRTRTSMDGIPRVFASSMIDRGPWRITVGIPLAVAGDRAAVTWWRSSAILIFGVIGWLVIAGTLSRRLAESVGHIGDAARRIAAGDFRPLQRRTMTNREFADLQDAFDQMLTRFNNTRDELDQHLGAERRMRLELQSLQRQVIRQERLAAVGQLVSGVAHEVNNPLQAILGFTELLQMQADVPDSVKNDLQLIQKESARACAIIRNLALFARQQPEAPVPVHLGELIAAVAELRVRRLTSENITLTVEDTSARPVAATISELQQVVLNFVVNAEQAILMSGQDGGNIVIRAYDRDDCAVLEVQDSGPGVQAGDEAKLFQPFFTTKPVGQGTGLGLSVSYGIIDSLGGRIGYRNGSHGGAVFFFELPVATAQIV